jgi:hypothetical protein
LTPADRRSALLSTAAAFLFASLLFLARLGELPFVQPDEGRNAQIAREMSASGAWLVPSYNGIPYLDKPAFHFRSVALSMELLGENEFAARLPSAIFGLLLLAMVFLYCRRFFGVRCAALSVAILAATPLYLAFARIVILDMTLALFVSLSVLAGFMAEARSCPAEMVAPFRVRFRPRDAGEGSSGLSHPVSRARGLLRGGEAIPGDPASSRSGESASLRSDRDSVVPGRGHPSPGLPTLWDCGETLRRYGTPAFHRTGPFYYYAPVLLAVFFPGAFSCPKRSRAPYVSARRWAGPTVHDDLGPVIVLFFSTSQSKLPGYILTAVVALAIMTARLFDRALDQPDGRAARLILRGVLILGGLSAGASLLLVAGVAEPEQVREILDMRTRDYARLAPLFKPVLLMMLGILAVSLLARWRRSVRLALAGMALFPVALLTVCFGGLRDYAEAGSARALARSIPALPARTEVACIESFPGGLLFYGRQNVTLITRDGHEMESNYLLYRLRTGPGWPDQLVPLERCEDWVASRPGPTFLISGWKGKGTLDEIAAHAGLESRPIVPGWFGVLLPKAAGS